MLLKPRIATNVVMIVGGGFFAVVGIAMWVNIGGLIGILPGLFGVLGVFWVCIGSIALLRRRSMAITIDEHGIELPGPRILRKGPPRIVLRRDEIATIEKHESVKGRLIEIGLRDHSKIRVQVRHYCELDDFIGYCKKFGLPSWSRKRPTPRVV